MHVTSCGYKSRRDYVFDRRRIIEKANVCAGETRLFEGLIVAADFGRFFFLCLFRCGRRRCGYQPLHGGFKDIIPNAKGHLHLPDQPEQVMGWQIYFFQLSWQRGFKLLIKNIGNELMKTDRKFDLARLPAIFSENFGLSWTVSLVVVSFITLVICFAIYWFIHSAPPRILTITSGPPGSTFERNAQKYRDILAHNGVTLKILPSQGSLENLQRLENSGSGVDIGFVQGGISDGTNVQALISLGNVSYEPLLVFYRGTTNITLLSGLAGKRLAIGSVGSGTHSLALTLLQTNGLTADGLTQLLNLDADAAAQGFLAGNIDAVFMMSDSASSQTMRTMLRTPGVQLLNFEQADAYTRRFNYLNKLRLPEGSIDFGKNLPSQDVLLIGPTVELVARPNLNAAVSDLLLEAAREVHGNASMFQNQGEFPNPTEHEYKISTDAARYYKSGKKFLYNALPFWVASLANRILVVFVPTMLVLIPGVRLIPAAYKWRVRLRFYRWYRTLLVLERELTGEMTPGKRGEMHRRLDEIEKVVKRMKVPASFADQFYGLRGHIDYVREKLAHLETV